MNKFKIGDKVVIKKDVTDLAFRNFSNASFCIKEIKSRKYVTITGFTESGAAVRFKEVEQFWRTIWFEPYCKQLEFNFDE